jgi:hypothetical protein
VDGTIFKKLEAEGFNEQADRLIYNGEILSTSARPSATLCALLKQKYFYAVHDEATASFLATCTDNGIYDYEGATDLGFTWVMDEANDDSFRLGELAKKLRTLPALIDMKTPQGLVGFSRRAIRSDMSWPKAVEEIKSGHPSMFEPMYCNYAVESVQGIDKVCIGEGYQMSQTGNVVSVGSKLTEISSLFKVVGILSRVESAVFPMLPPQICRESAFPAAAVA